MERDSAQRALADLELRWAFGKSESQIFSRAPEPNSISRPVIWVVDQDPESGEKVERGAVVAIETSRHRNGEESGLNR